MPRQDSAKNSGSVPYRSIEFDIWGARGSRNLTPPSSHIANYTSCYSIRAGQDVFVIDGGRGLGLLSQAIERDRRFRTVTHVHLFLSHSHMDHWEGLKDASWFWRAGNGLQLHIYGTQEALDTVRSGYGHPAYVPLEILASRTLRSLRFTALEAKKLKKVRGFAVRTFALNHYSGEGDFKNALDTVGYRIKSPDGFVFSYLCDHEPTPETSEVENRLISGAHLAVVDAHFPNRSQHAFGHGSQEHAAELARRFPETLVLAGHHGPTYSDSEIRKNHRAHGKGLDNFAIAEEESVFRFSTVTGRLSRKPGRRTKI